MTSAAGTFQQQDAFGSNVFDPVGSGAASALDIFAPIIKPQHAVVAFGSFDGVDSGGGGAGGGGGGTGIRPPKRRIVRESHSSSSPSLPHDVVGSSPNTLVESARDKRSQFATSASNTVLHDQQHRRRRRTSSLSSGKRGRCAAQEEEQRRFQQQQHQPKQQQGVFCLLYTSPSPRDRG